MSIFESFVSIHMSCTEHHVVFIVWAMSYSYVAVHVVFHLLECGYIWSHYGKTLEYWSWQSADFSEKFTQMFTSGKPLRGSH